MERRLKATVEVDVEVAEWHEDPKRATTDLINEALTPHVHSPSNWNGRFIIITGFTVEEPQITEEVRPA